MEGSAEDVVQKGGANPATAQMCARVPDFGRICEMCPSLLFTLGRARPSEHSGSFSSRGLRLGRERCQRIVSMLGLFRRRMRPQLRWYRDPRDFCCGEPFVGISVRAVKFYIASALVGMLFAVLRGRSQVRRAPSSCWICRKQAAKQYFSALARHRSACQPLGPLAPRCWSALPSLLALSLHSEQRSATHESRSSLWKSN